MKRILCFSSLALLLMVSISCQKETATPGGTKTAVEKRADSLTAYVVSKHFIPVDFYSDVAIDYDETDNITESITDLKKFILPYLADDVITFNSDKSLVVNQNAQKMPGNDSAVLNRKWDITFSKSKNEVYLTYLDYFYEPSKYTLVEFTDTNILAYVNWTSTKNPGLTAKLYTRFQRQ